MSENITDKSQELAALPNVSYSKIGCYKTCSKAYKFCYIDKLPRLDKPYTTFGNFCHKTLETFHRALIDKTQLSLEALLKDSFVKAIAEFKEKLTKDQIQAGFIIMQEYLDMYSDYEGENVPNVVSVEKKINLNIDNEFMLIGFIDRIDLCNDGKYHVIDYKTTSDERFLKDRMQLLLYAYSLYDEDKSIESVKASYMLLKHKMKFLSGEHLIEEILAAKNKFKESWNIIKDDKLFRASPIAYKCKNCDYSKYCDEGQSLLFGKKKFGKMDW